MIAVRAFGVSCCPSSIRASARAPTNPAATPRRDRGRLSRAASRAGTARCPTSGSFGMPSRTRQSCAVASPKRQYSSSNVGLNVSSGSKFSCAGIIGGPSTKRSRLAIVDTASSRAARRSRTRCSRYFSSVSRVGLRLVENFGQVDRMRLLPHDERVHRARALAPFGPDHLRPPGAAHAVRLRARLAPSAAAPKYHGMLRSSSSGRPHTAKCAACQACISRWNLPFQLFENRPSSCGGRLPALLIAVRYCDITTRRSSSCARGSLLPVKSTTPPCIQ